jgi:hypothetical protein
MEDLEFGSGNKRGDSVGALDKVNFGPRRMSAFANITPKIARRA